VNKGRRRCEQRAARFVRPPCTYVNRGGHKHGASRCEQRRPCSQVCAVCPRVVLRLASFATLLFSSLLAARPTPSRHSHFPHLIMCGKRKWRHPNVKHKKVTMRMSTYAPAAIEPKSRFPKTSRVRGRCFLLIG